MVGVASRAEVEEVEEAYTPVRMVVRLITLGILCDNGIYGLHAPHYDLNVIAPPPLPVRPASPLPPGVPTGPRNQNKYKDRDGNAPAVDGLDYGGIKDSGGRTPSGEPEDRSGSR